jgi:hypothetical protein
MHSRGLYGTLPGNAFLPATGALTIRCVVVLQGLRNWGGAALPQALSPVHVETVPRRHICRPSPVAYGAVASNMVRMGVELRKASL